MLTLVVLAGTVLMMVVITLGLFKAAGLKRVEDFIPAPEKTNEWTVSARSKIASVGGLSPLARSVLGASGPAVGHIHCRAQFRPERSDSSVIAPPE